MLALDRAQNPSPFVNRQIDFGDGDAPMSDIDNPFVEDYKIKKGDNLTKIAKANGTTVEALLKANPQIKSPNLIYAGQTLKIPVNVPTVVPGANDTDLDAFNESDFEDDPQASDDEAFFAEFEAEEAAADAEFNAEEQELGSFVSEDPLTDV